MTSTRSDELQHDQLNVIKGIGEATEQMLKESLDVRTYADLAASPVDAIESALKAGGRPVARANIEAWRARAAELSGHHDAPVTSELRCTANAPVTLEITRIATYQPAQSESPRSSTVPGEKFTGTLSHRESVEFEVTVKLKGTGARERAICLSKFKTEIYAFNRTTSVGERMTAIARGCVEATTSTFTMRLPAFQLPIGTYRLECSTGLEGESSTKDCVEIPYLRVA